MKISRRGEGPVIYNTKMTANMFSGGCLAYALMVRTCGQQRGDSWCSPTAQVVLAKAK